MTELPEELDHISSDDVLELDVRPILERGDKPFDAIMSAAEEVADGGALKLIAPFKPAPLVRVLERQGWDHQMTRAPEGEWIVWFFRT